MKKIKLLFFFSLFTFSSSFTFGQYWMWGAGGAGTALATFGDVWLNAADNADNIYFADDNPVGLVKYNGSGIYQRSYVAPPYIVSICCDKQNNLYILGYINTYDTPFIIGSYVFTTSSGDLVLIKYNSAGNLVWATSSKCASSKSVASGYTFDYNAICTDEPGNIYITGQFTDTVNFGTQRIISKIPNSFLAKYDSSGNAVWARSPTLTPTSSSLGYSVGTDGHGNVYEEGYLKDTAVFGLDTVKGHAANSFFVKYDSAGNVQWAINIPCEISEMRTDEAGNGYMVSNYTGPFTLGTFTLLDRGIFLAKYNTAGNVAWAVSGNPINYNLGVTSVCPDNCGNIFVSVGTGYSNVFYSAYTDSSRFGGDTLVETGSDPVFVLDYDTSGTLRCVSSLESGGDDESSIVADNFGNTFLCGDFMTSFYFSSPFIVGPDTLVETGNPPEFGFIAKWHGCAGSCETQDGINEVKGESEKLKVFPNPFTNSTTISIPYSLSTSHFLELDDITGRILKHLEFTGNAYTLSAEGLAKGMYFIRVFDGDYHLLGVSKIVVQ